MGTGMREYLLRDFAEAARKIQEYKDFGLNPERVVREFLANHFGSHNCTMHFAPDAFLTAFGL